MRKRFALLPVLALSFALLAGNEGCDQKETAAKVTAASNAAKESVPAALETAEPVVSALETATGKTLPADAVEQGESVASKVNEVSDKLDDIAALVATVPGPQQPIAGGLAAALGAVTAISGAIAAFLQRRKSKALAKAAVKVAHAAPDGGGNLVAVATDAGVAKDVKRAYANAIVNDEINPTYSATAAAAEG